MDEALLQTEVQKGYNCELYVAAVVRTLGYFIPDFCCRSLELSQDDRYTQRVDYTRDLPQTGDIIGFSRLGETDLRQTHLAVVRVHPSTGELDVVHAARKNGRVGAIPIASLMQDPLYQQIVFVKRPTFSLQGLINYPAQEHLGFWSIRRTIGI